MGRPTDKQTRPKSPPPDIPPDIVGRPRFKKLPPGEELAFLREQAAYEAAYRQTGDPLPLWEALRHVELAGQTVPSWLSMALLHVVIQARTDKGVRRSNEREQQVRRYTCVRDLRQKGYSRDRALDQAVIDLRAEGDEVMRRGVRRGVSRDTVEDSYDKVRKDLKRRGRDSEFYFFVLDEED